MAEFGENLKKARELKGVTQQTLASKLYVTRQAVSQWENGSRFLDLMMTKKIADALDVSVNDLVSDNQNEYQSENAPLIQNNVLNNIIIALYGFIAIDAILVVSDIFIRLKFVQSIPSSTWPYLLVFEILSLIALAGIFITGAIWAIKGKLNSDRTGTMIVIFFVLSAVLGLEKNGMMFTVGSLHASAAVFRLLLCIIGPAVGAVCAFVFFKCRTVHPCYIVGILCATAYMIIIASFNQITSMSRQTSPGLLTTLGTYLQIAALILIVIQTITLLKKRQVRLKKD